MTEYIGNFGMTILTIGIVLYVIMWLIARWLRRVNDNLEAHLEAIKEGNHSAINSLANYYNHGEKNYKLADDIINKKVIFKSNDLPFYFDNI